MTLLVFGYALGWFGLFALSLLPALLFRGRWGAVVIVLVISTWVGFAWWKIQKPENDRKHLWQWMQSVHRECETHRPKVPDVVEVDGILDEGAALRKSEIRQMFAERRLSFIEVKVRHFQGEPRISKPDGDNESGWTLPNAPAPWVRLELSDERDSRCTELPDGLKGRFSETPFLPDTCVALTHLESPTARYGLLLDPADRNPDRRRAGTWKVVDRLTGSTIAALPTTDTVSENSIGSSHLTSESTGARQLVADCGDPYHLLLDRVTGVPGQPLQQVLAVERVAMRIGMQALGTAEEPLPAVQVRTEGVSSGDDDRGRFFREDAKKWRTAVALARERGTAQYGPMLLDWNDRKLSELVSAGGHTSWTISAAEDGFFALEANGTWYKRQSNLLLRFRRDGSLAWGVRVLTPPSKIEGNCKDYFYPTEVHVAPSEVELASRCERWFIDRKVLPNLR